MEWLRRVKQKNSMFNTLLVSYIVILLLPIAAGLFLFQRIELIMLHHSNRANQGLLEQVRLAAEHRFAEIDQMTLQIALNPKVRWALSHKEEDHVNKQFNIFDMMKELRNVRNISSFVDEVYVYFKESETIVTTMGKSDSHTFFQDILLYEGKSAEWVKNEMFTGYRPGTYYPADTSNAPGNQDRRFTYVQSLPLGERTRVEGYIAVLINEQQFSEMIEQIQKTNSGVIHIVDERLQTIISTARDTALNTEVLARLSGKAGVAEFRQQDEDMMLSYTTGTNGWKFISVVSRQAMLQEVTVLKSWALVLLAVCVAIGIAASYSLTYLNYSPIRDIVRTIRKLKNHVHRERSNEAELIKQSLLQSFEENHRLNQTLSAQSPVFRASFLSRLIKGDVDPSALNDYPFVFGDVQFTDEYFGVLIVEITDCSEFVAGDTRKEWKLVRFIVSNIGADVLGQRNYVVELERDRLAILSNCAEPAGQHDEWRHTAIEKMKQEIFNQFKVKLTVGVSKIHHGIGEIGKCYREALMALEYTMIYGSGIIIYYEEIAGLQQDQYHYPLETETQLVNYSRSGDYSKVEGLLDLIYEWNFHSRGISPDMGRLLFFELLGTCVKIVNGLGLADHDRLRNTLDPSACMAGNPSAEEMFVFFKMRFMDICDCAVSDKSEHGEKLYVKITQYIDKHYGNADLSLAFIADHLQITAQYLSFFFKKHSSRTLTEYIANVRLNEAKKLLRDESATLAEISHKIGYTSVVGFVRFFKKYEGVPPGRYREMMEEQANPQNPRET